MLTNAPATTPAAALTGINAMQGKPHIGALPIVSVVITLILHNAPDPPHTVASRRGCARTASIQPRANDAAAVNSSIEIHRCASSGHIDADTSRTATPTAAPEAT
ncbi:hypothetical protein A5648_09155 [Mycolicibacter sinensis]|uniref:Uncharacterized protein n=1 Tax=Mycolicibacter sinensis (strain JDM601) TaxID=875328 RepID=A0A1A3TQ91_MYCSD|nr:hypothetical protein A5648_09155 [Mycolicibacter sinensis]